MCVARPSHLPYYLFFFFNDTATTEIYTLSLHDALPISPSTRLGDTLLRQVGLPGRTTPKASTTSGCAIRQRARILKKLLLLRREFVRFSAVGARNSSSSIPAIHRASGAGLSRG